MDVFHVFQAVQMVLNHNVSYILNYNWFGSETSPADIVMDNIFRK